MNPTIHFSAVELEQYRRGQLSSEKRNECELHLAECADCCAVAKPMELAKVAARWQAELSAAICEEPCLTEEQVLSYLKQDDLSPALHSQKAHLAACADCRLAVEEMRELQASLTVTPVRPPVFKDSRRVLSIKEEKKKGKIFLLHWPWPKIGWAMAAMMLALTGVFLWQAPWMGDRKGELVQSVTPTPLPLNSLPSTAATSAVILNDDGGQIILNEKGELNGLEQLPEEAALAVKSALQTQSVKLPSTLAELHRTPSSDSPSLMDGAPDKGGTEKSFRVLQPVGQIVRTTQPEFRWQPLKGASSYTVTVFEPDFSEIAVSPALAATSWKPEKPLPRGPVLYWQVRAVTNAGEQVTPSLAESPAKLKVLDKTLNDKLRRIEQTHANSHLTLGVLYAQAGLKEEAATQFRALLNANPESALAKKLLASVNR